MNYELNFKCMLHNLRFAFDRPDGIEPAILRCPVCAHERELLKDKAMQQVKEHRDALVKAIDLTRLEPERDDGGAGHLRKQARRLLEQLATNRPRRALDLMDAQRLLERVAAPADTDKLIADLIRAAWEWGVSCEVDDVRWGEAGDSHNQMLRDRTHGLATQLQAQLPARLKTPNDRGNAEPAA